MPSLVIVSPWSRLNNSLTHQQSMGCHGFQVLKKIQRLFWIFIVISGFSGAGYLIYGSFHNWSKSPISTTIVTHPIQDITLPNITVCPPKDSFLNLNYDIVQLEKMKIDNKTRNDLAEITLEVI